MSLANESIHRVPMPFIVGHAHHPGIDDLSVSRSTNPAFPPISTQRQFVFRESKPWPLIIQGIARQRKPEDKGVGDTVHRILHRLGAGAFEWVMRKAGVNCGCSDRRVWLNSHYRYNRTKLSAQPWIEHDETIAKPKSDKLVITVATGGYSEVLDISRSRIQHYAKKCGADYVELTNETQPWWGLEKFRVRHFQPHYKRILFIDCDILVRPDSPDLFKIVPEDSVGIHDDAPCERDRTKALTWAYRQRFMLFESQSLKKEINGHTLLNTGVVMCSSHHDIWQPMRKPFPGNHTDEQIWIEQQIEDYPVHQLDKRFNNQIRFQDFQATKADSWFVHFAGSKEKINTMRSELASW
jgi:hypothetical protein